MNTAVLPFCAPAGRTRPADRAPSSRRARRTARRKQDIRLDRERARDRDALAHAAGERMRIVVLVAPQAEPLEPAARDRLRLACARRRGFRGRAARWRARCATASGGRSGTRCRSCRGRTRNRGTGRARSTATVPVVGSIRPAIRLNMVDLPQPVLPSTATISPCAIVERQPLDRDEVAAAVGAAEHLGDVVERMTGFAIGRPLTSPARRPRGSAAPRFSIATIVCCTTSTNSTSCKVQAMAPAMSNNCCWRSSW